MTGQLAVGDARRRTLELAGSPVAALQCGARDAPPVLLVPGYTGSKEDFAPLLAPLAAAGYLVTAIDLPGQFESPGPSDVCAYSPDRLATCLLDFARGARTPVRLVGHSYGGLVARAAVIAAPSAFESLTLLSSGPAAIEGRRRSVMDALEPVLATSGVPGVHAALQAADAANPAFVAPPADLASFFERRFLAGSPTMLAGMAAALRTEPDRVSELGTTGVPVLVVHGAGDDAWPPPVQAEMARRLGARYEVIADAAHSAGVENPAALAATLIDFWSG